MSRLRLSILLMTLPTGGANGNPSPYTIPMTYAGPQGGQTYPMQSQQTSSTVVVQQPPSAVLMTRDIHRDMPQDYMICSVIGCLCCLWPIGICAIMASSNSRSKADRGDMDGAKCSGQCALCLNIFNTLLTIVGFAVIVLMWKSIQSA